MAAGNPPFDFYKWSEEQIEESLQFMGCQDSSVGALSLPTKAVLLNSEDTAPPTSKECLKSLQSTKYQLFNDPIHGSIELHPLLAKIVNMRAFTRLKNIRQLGGVYYVYHGATHTRFEHSIGTCYIAGEFIRMLQRKQPELHISEKEALCVEIAALCHDLGHGPFSHLFEKDVIKQMKNDHELPQLNTFPKHEKLSTMVFEHHVYFKEKDLFNSYGIGDQELQFIKELIDHDLSSTAQLQKPKRRFLYEIVANKCTGIDVDKWDYFARDCHYMGILTEFDWRRLMAVSRVIKVEPGDEYRICYREKEVNNIYGMFRTRCSLHQKAYQHKSVIAAEHMIAHAILMVKNIPLIKPWNADDISGSSCNELTSVLIALEKVIESPPKLEDYLALNDSIVQLILNCTQCTEDNKIPLQKAQMLLRHLDQREKFQFICSESKVSKLSVSETEILECDESTDDKLELDDIYIRCVRISYASEKNDKGEMGDPVEVTYFYTKDKPWKAIRGDDSEIKKSELIRPIEFESVETRLYGSPGSIKRRKVSQAYEKAKKRKTDSTLPSAANVMPDLSNTPAKPGNNPAEGTPSSSSESEGEHAP